VLGIREKVLGPEHPDTAISVSGLALLLKAKGDYEGAEPLYRRALAIREKVLGPEHPDTATSVNNLASLLYTKGDYAGAEPLYRRALGIREKVLGPEHPNSLSVLNAIASCLRLKGDRDNAFAICSKLIGIGESILNRAEAEGRPDRINISRWTAIAYNEIAFHRDAPSEDWTSAEVGFRRAVELMAGAGEPVELANMELNLQTVLHRSRKGADIGKVIELTSFLEEKGDPRAAKGRAILDAGPNPPG
jgi:tetratricopeptide (TPR) repeat protein